MSDFEPDNKDLIERCLASMGNGVIKVDHRTNPNMDTRRRIEDIQMRSDLDKLELVEQVYIDNG